METQSCVEDTRNESSDVKSSQNIFTRANIVSRESQIRLVDSDEETGLDLFCYNSCSNEDEEFIKQCRGIVFHEDKLVMKAFSYTDEYSHNNIDSSLFTDFDKWSFFTAYEGALLRLFHFSGKWFLSTHRKLNAFRSKWASRDSFGALFQRALLHEIKVNKKFSNRVKECTEDNVLERFQSTLDTNKQYMFLLRNSYDNRIVCDVPEEDDSFVFHVGTFVNGELTMDEEIDLYYPAKLHFKNLDELVCFTGDIDPMKLQGIICFSPGNEKIIKILNEDYMEMFRARGNEPSIKFRYLQVRLDKKMTDMLYRLYPNSSHIFDEYENTIYDIAKGIYRSYVQRFIKKHHVIVPREEYQVVVQCHSWHLADREKNRISLDRVIQILNKQPPTNINHMIRRVKIEQDKKKGILPRTMKGSRNNSAVNSPAVLVQPSSDKNISSINLN